MKVFALCNENKHKNHKPVSRYKHLSFRDYISSKRFTEHKHILSLLTTPAIFREKFISTMLVPSTPSKINYLLTKYRFGLNHRNPDNSTSSSFEFLFVRVKSSNIYSKSS